jgi:hypothetical protein
LVWFNCIVWLMAHTIRTNSALNWHADWSAYLRRGHGRRCVGFRWPCSSNDWNEIGADTPKFRVASLHQSLQWRQESSERHSDKNYMVLISRSDLFFR